MSIKPTKVQFNGGELSPWLEGRTDIAKYDKTAKLCRNFIPLAEGSLKRRGGTRFVAETVTWSPMTFKIEAYPEEAQIMMNEELTDTVEVVRGDVVEFEVQAKGYASQSGRVVVSDNMTLTVRLISNVLRCKLVIVPVPADAIVKIAGVQRSSYEAQQNTRVRYLVYKNGYAEKSGEVLMDTNKTLTVTLDTDQETGGSYGDWGTPEYFVACTAVGYDRVQLKCFCIRFTAGYLMIVFKANLNVPDDAAEWLFFKTDYDRLDTVAYKNNTYYPARLVCMNKSYDYYGSNGAIVASFDKALTMKVVGWQLDEDRQYASFYKRYDGTVSGTVVRIFYEGKKVWTMKERKNV